MLEIVEVRTKQGSLLSLPLEDISSGIVVKEIAGLDPVKATLVSSSFANQDGEQYHSSRREARNIKMTLEFDPDWATMSVREIRNRLYEFFMPKSEVGLRFRFAPGLTLDSIFDDLVVDILGRVESFETPLFSKEPAVDISLLCFDPDFYDPNPVTVEGFSTSGSLESTINYAGTVETGIVFKLFVDRTLSEFSIYHRPPDGTMRTIDFSNPLVAGDVVTISTIVGAKEVVRTRSGLDTPILYAITPQSHWLEFQSGENHIRVYAEGADIPYTIEYTTKYGGL